MIMIQPQQVYQHFSPTSVVKHEGSVASPPSVIKETESIRNLSLSHSTERQRSVSPIDRTMHMRRSVSPVATTKVIISPKSVSLSMPVTRDGDIESRRIIKRSNSIEYDDDEPLDGSIAMDEHIDDRRMDKDDIVEPQYDSEPDGRDYDRLQDYGNGHNATDDEDLPLDLSLSTERRRTRTYSDSESDDSAGTGEEKTGGKAAYKKSLMKRYRK